MYLPCLLSLACLPLTGWRLVRKDVSSPCKSSITIGRIFYPPWEYWRKFRSVQCPRLDFCSTCCTKSSGSNFYYLGKNKCGWWRKFRGVLWYLCRNISKIWGNKSFKVDKKEPRQCCVYCVFQGLHVSISIDFTHAKSYRRKAIHMSPPTVWLQIHKERKSEAPCLNTWWSLCCGLGIIGIFTYCCSA